MTSVTLKRILPAPSSDVYRAWLAPEILVRWAAPIEYDAARVEVDERVGGHYRCWHVDADGRDVGGFECEILELVPNERIVLKWDFVGPDREPLAPHTTSRLTITLRTLGSDSCELTLVHERLDDLERRSPGMTDAARLGWTGTLDRLGDLVRTMRRRTP